MNENTSTEPEITVKISRDTKIPEIPKNKVKLLGEYPKIPNYKTSLNTVKLHKSFPNTVKFSKIFQKTIEVLKDSLSYPILIPLLRLHTSVIITDCNR